MGRVGGCQGGCEQSFCVNSKKWWGLVGLVGVRSGGVVGGGQGGCERNVGCRGWYRGCEPRIEGIVQCTCQGRCERRSFCKKKRRIEVLVKIIKKKFGWGGGGGGGFRVDVNEELKFLCKFKKTRGGGGSGGGSQGGCERRVKVFVEIKKR